MNLIRLFWRLVATLHEPRNSYEQCCHGKANRSEILFCLRRHGHFGDHRYVNSR